VIPGIALDVLIINAAKVYLAMRRGVWSTLIANNQDLARYALMAYAHLMDIVCLIVEWTRIVLDLVKLV
jgi:cytosine/uracil/thiamine/allantoin permease